MYPDNRHRKAGGRRFLDDIERYPVPTKEESIKQVERAIAECEQKIAGLETRTDYYHPAYPDTLQWSLDYFRKRLEELRQ